MIAELLISIVKFFNLCLIESLNSHWKLKKLTIDGANYIIEFVVNIHKTFDQVRITLLLVEMNSGIFGEIFQKYLS